jgi:hypothetical protein
LSATGTRTAATGAATFAGVAVLILAVKKFLEDKLDEPKQVVEPQ